LELPIPAVRDLWIFHPGDFFTGVSLKYVKVLLFGKANVSIQHHGNLFGVCCHASCPENQALKTRPF